MKNGFVFQNREKVGAGFLGRKLSYRWFVFVEIMDPSRLFTLPPVLPFWITHHFLNHSSGLGLGLGLGKTQKPTQKTKPKTQDKS